MGIRIRLTIVFTSMLVIIIGLSGVLLLLKMRADLRSTIDDSLRSRADVIRSVSGLGATSAGSLIEKDESFAQIIGPGGKVEQSSPGLPEDEPLLISGLLEPLDEPRFFERELTVEEETFPARLLAVRLDGGRVLVVGSSLEDQREAVNILAGVLIVGGPVLAGVGAIIVWSITGAALRPVEKLRQEADALSVSELGRPLMVPETNDEIARLGKSLNGLLERVAEAFDRERRFLDEASHELRTPVSTLKAELELALSGSATVDEMRGAIQRASADADYLSLLTEDLLVLARTDGGRLPIRKTEVDLEELVSQVVSGFAKRTESLGASIEVGVGGVHLLDPLRMRQVLNNLIDNSLRHGRSGNSIAVRTRRDDGGLILEVEDRGPGFAGELLGSEGVSNSTTTGLGLRIVEAIASAHGGTLELENAPSGGALVRLRLPPAK